MKCGKDVSMINRVSKNKYYLYTVSFVISSFIILIPFVLKGNSLIANGDTYNGLFPAFVYIKEFWKELFAGRFNSFSFSIGLGEDPFTAMSWSGVFDIISIIVALLTPLEYIEFGFGINIIIRIYFCGISFLLFSDRHVKCDKIAIVGALLYAFNVYTLFWGMYYYLFITPVLVLPLVLRGIDQIIEGEKIDFVMIIALCIQGLNGFYYLYMIVLAAIIYYIFVAIFRVGLKNKDSVKCIINNGIYVAMNGIWGIALSGIVFIPSILGLFASSRDLKNNFSTDLICKGEYFLKSISSLFIPSVWESELSFSNIAVAGIILYFFVRNKKKEFLYITIVLWCMLWCPMWGSIMNGFSYSTDRWFFILTFFVNIVMIMAFDSKDKMPKKGWCVYFLILGISAIIHVISAEKNIGLWIRIVVFSLLAGILPIALKQKKKVLAYGFCVVAAMVLFVFWPRVVGGNGYSANFRSNDVYNEITDSYNSLEMKDDKFERWDIHNSSYSAALIGKYYGTTSYYSTLNKNIYNFYANMNISPGIESAFTLRGLDSRQELLSLLSVAQYMDFPVEEGMLNPIIQKNEYYLPLGFTYDSYISEDEFSKLNSIKRNSQIINTIVLEEEISKLNKGILNQNELTEIDFEIVEKSDDNVRIYLSFENYEEQWSKRSGSVYATVENLHGVLQDCSIANKKFRILEPEHIYYTNIDDYLINITELKKDLNGWYFDIDFQGENDFENSKLKVYWEDIDYKAIEERGKNTLKNLEILNNRIVGEISTTKNEMLFFSIPYSSGWKAYIDGEESELYKANIGFMAVLVEEGKHNIELRYETPGFKAGLACSVVAMIMLIMVFVYNKKHKWNGDIE